MCHVRATVKALLTVLMGFAGMKLLLDTTAQSASDMSVWCKVLSVATVLATLAIGFSLFYGFIEKESHHPDIPDWAYLIGFGAALGLAVLVVATRNEIPSTLAASHRNLAVLVALVTAIIVIEFAYIAARRMRR